MTRSKSSSKWLKEHHNDYFVLQARSQGYRSRAVFKLKEINEKDQIIKKNMTVVELGAAPGGWSQYVAQCLQNTGNIIALDLLPIEPLDGVVCLQGDFSDEIIYQKLLAELNGVKVDLVLSDIAPNTSGVKAVDHDRSMYLVELVVDFAKNHLILGGDLLVKVFHGAGFDQLFKQLKVDFDKVFTRKPLASRARSQETYLLARGFKHK